MNKKSVILVTLLCFQPVTKASTNYDVTLTGLITGAISAFCVSKAKANGPWNFCSKTVALTGALFTGFCTYSVYKNLPGHKIKQALKILEDFDAKPSLRHFDTVNDFLIFIEKAYCGYTRPFMTFFDNCNLWLATLNEQESFIITALDDLKTMKQDYTLQICNELLYKINKVRQKVLQRIMYIKSLSDFEERAIRHEMIKAQERSARAAEETARATKDLAFNTLVAGMNRR